MLHLGDLGTSPLDIYFSILDNLHLICVVLNQPSHHLKFTLNGRFSNLPHSKAKGRYSITIARTGDQRNPYNNVSQLIHTLADICHQFLLALLHMLNEVFQR